MKTIILIFFQITLFSSTLFSQETISLTVSAQGKTKEEAKYNAFREALERAFGTFISSNTQILNDEIIKDEIVSVSSGNIEKFEIKSEVQLPDATFANVIDVTVSLNKLKSFCESKGINVEFQGSLFTANIRIEKMNKENEESITRNMFETVHKIIQNGIFDYSISIKEPKSSRYYTNSFDLDIEVLAKFNINIESVNTLILSTLEGVSLNKEAALKYSGLNIPYYVVQIDNAFFCLRNWKSIEYIRHIFERLIPYYVVGFDVENGIYNFNFRNDILSKNLKESKQNINLRGWLQPLYDRDFDYNKFNYYLYPSESAFSFRDYYDLLSNYGLDMNRIYHPYDIDFENKIAGPPGSYNRDESDFLKMRRYSPINGSSGKIYAKIFLSRYSKCLFAFEFTQSYGLTELEKIKEYKVIPRQ